MTGTQIRIALIDDHRVVLEGLMAILLAQPDFSVVAAATDSEEGLRAILETSPDVIILDVDLPGRGAFDISEELLTRRPGTKLLFLSGFLSNILLEQALRLNCSGYLLKGERSEVILTAVRDAVQGKCSFSPAVQSRLRYDEHGERYVLESDIPLSSLTSRQLEVLRHLARGESVKEVARMLHLSQKSVDSHKYRIMHKLGIHDRVLLARYAIREGLTVP